MHINIDIQTAEGLSELDLAVLRALLGESGASAPVSSPTSAKAAPAKAPAAKVAEKAEKAAPAKAEPEPEEEDEASDSAEDADAVDTGTIYTKKDAVALATKLVSEGQAANVKKVLTDLGAKRVSELADEDVPAFIAALS